jgi:alpha 1,3-glucosidase
MISLAVLLLLAATVSVDAVERSKFRTCEQTAFCVRNRALRTDANAVRDSYAVSSASSASGVLNVNVAVQREGAAKAHAPTLALDVAMVRRDVARVSLSDRHAKRVAAPRNDVLIEGDGASVDGVVVHGSRVVGELLAVSVDASMRIQVHDVKSNQLLVDVGARALTQFEYVREREHDDVAATVVKSDAVKPDTWDDEADGVWQAPTEANPAAESRWKESFGGSDDAKRYGPTSVGADVRFAAATHVYGIPEHAASFSLKPTLVGGAPVADPYRLYNLDVFEYELDNNMALYGSVPFLVAHSGARTVGFLWLNPTETFVDVETAPAAASTRTGCPRAARSSSTCSPARRRATSCSSTRC